jgi:hypothetical protein
MGKNMKHYLFIFISILVLSGLYAKPVQAISNESDSGAMLADKFTITDNRIDKLRNYLSAHNSPVADEAQSFIAIADKYNLDWKLIAAISGLESSFCQHIPTNSYNCWGWGIPTGAQSGIGFTSFKDGINTVSEGIRMNYLNNGYITIEQIGRIYAASPTWAIRVRSFMNEIDAWENHPSFTNLPVVI